LCELLSMGFEAGWKFQPCTEFPSDITHDVELIEMHTK
jgi:hypothetical protein